MWSFSVIIFLCFYVSISRTSAIAIGARRIAWLQASDLEIWVQDKLGNIPCTGENLCGKNWQENANEIDSDNIILDRLSKSTADPARKKSYKKPFFSKKKKFYPSYTQQGHRLGQSAQKGQPKVV